MSESTTTNPQTVITQPAPAGGIVDVTDKALQKFKSTLETLDGAIGFRLGVSGGGCAGLQYDIKECHQAMTGDFVQESGGLQFFIHPVAAAYLKGTTIDYSDDLVDGGFKFKNPNATSTCGCGTSFGI